MQRADWKQTVDSLPSPCSEAVVNEVAGHMREAALAPGRAAFDAFCTEGHVEAGRDLLLALGAASIEPILQSKLPADPNQRAWLLQHLVQAELELRARVLAKVEALLDDRAWLADPTSGLQLEVRPPPRRVCDEAYVGLRRLVHPEEDRVGYKVESDAFLHMPPELKDRTIQQARTAHTWNLKPPTPDEAGY